MPVLCECRRQVGEGVCARKIVIAILTHESARCQDRSCVEYVRPRRGNIKGVDECSLVLPYSCLIELIWLLKPGARIVKVHVKAVLRARPEV